MKRRIIIILIALTMVLCVAFLSGCQKKEEKYPNKSIELVIPYKAGGSSDITARTFASYLEKELGTTITITNIGGGGTVEGTIYAYNQPSDGYTIMSVTNSHLMKEAQNALDFKFTEKFTPLCNMCKDVAMLAVKADSQFQTFDDLVAYAKEHPGELTKSGVSAGAGDEFNNMQINKAMGIELTFIPYEGTSEAKAAVLGNECVILDDKVLSISSLVKSGDLRPLITNSASRITTLDWLDGIPCFEEYGILTSEIFRGIAIKSDVPEDVQKTLIEACNRVQENKEWQKWLEEQNLNILIPEKDVTKIKEQWVKEKDGYIEFYKELGTI